MPQFAPGETKTAIAPITAKPAGMACEAELFLGPDELTKVSTSGRIPFVSTGASQSVSLPIAMPSEPGTYHGYIDVFTNGMRFLAYKTVEDIVIVAAAPPAFNIGTPTAQVFTDPGAPAFKTVDFWCPVSNPTGMSLTRRFFVYWIYCSKGTETKRPRRWNWDGSIHPTYFDVTLNPGESYQVYSPYHFIDRWGDDVGNAPAISTGSCQYIWLEDEFGNRSRFIKLLWSGAILI